MFVGGRFKPKKLIYHNNACGRVLCVYRAAKMLHMWINVTVNCFLRKRIWLLTALPWLQVLNCILSDTPRRRTIGERISWLDVIARRCRCNFNIVFFLFHAWMLWPMQMDRLTHLFVFVHICLCSMWCMWWWIRDTLEINLMGRP